MTRPPAGAQPPLRLADLPRDARGFIVPAEAGWDERGPLIKNNGTDQTFGLAFMRACAVCGYRLAAGEPVYRLFAQAEAADRRQMRTPSREDSNPGHLVCMLYASQVCPFWSRPDARLGKDSKLAPGARRGGLAALLGYEDYNLLIPFGAPLGGPELVYTKLVDDIRFRSPEELADRYEQARVADIQPPGPRHFWTNSSTDVRAIGTLLRRGFQAANKQARTAERIWSEHGDPYAMFPLPLLSR